MIFSVGLFYAHHSLEHELAALEHLIQRKKQTADVHQCSQGSRVLVAVAPAANCKELSRQPGSNKHICYAVRMIIRSDDA